MMSIRNSRHLGLVTLTICVLFFSSVACTFWVNLPALIHQGSCSQYPDKSKDKDGKKQEPPKCHWPYQDKTVEEN